MLSVLTETPSMTAPTQANILPPTFQASWPPPQGSETSAPGKVLQIALTRLRLIVPPSETRAHHRRRSGRNWGVGIRMSGGRRCAEARFAFLGRRIGFVCVVSGTKQPVDRLMLWAIGTHALRRRDWWEEDYGS